MTMKERMLNGKPCLTFDRELYDIAENKRKNRFSKKIPIKSALP